MSERSITRFLRSFQIGEDSAFDGIFEYYFDQLSRFARKQISSVPRRAADEEDIALSALNHLAGAVKQGRYPDLKDRSELWKLLTVITIHKASDFRKWSNARKRRVGSDGGIAPPKSPGAAAANDLKNVAGHDESPEAVVDFRDELDRLMTLLNDDQLREIAVLRMAGESVLDISNKLGIAVRSVERKLSGIRTCWSAELTDE